MSRYQRLLVPTDFSAEAERALAYAAALARVENAELSVVHALQERVFFGPEAVVSVAPPEANVSERRDAALKALAAVPEPVPSLASAMKRDLILSAPAKGIVEYAREHRSDLICLGTGRSDLPRYKLGSVAERVVREAGCSVLVARRKEHPFMSPDDGAIRINRILVPVDFSKYSTGAIQHAFGLAKVFGATVELLHIVDENSPARSNRLRRNGTVQSYLRDLVRSAATKLDRIKSALGSNITVERHVQLGSPNMEILHRAKERFSDLIVMGTHGRTGIARWFLGSVTEMMVRKAPCPVLVTRTAKKPFIDSSHPSRRTSGAILRAAERREDSNTDSEQTNMLPAGANKL